MYIPLDCFSENWNTIIPLNVEWRNGIRAGSLINILGLLSKMVSLLSYGAHQPVTDMTIFLVEKNTRNASKTAETA